MLGMNYTEYLRKRKSLLRETILLIEQIKIEIEYLKLPLGDIIKKLSENPSTMALDYLSLCDTYVKKGLDFPDAWSLSLKSSSLNYKTEEKDKLLQLGKSIGCCDIKGQMSIFEIYLSYFNEFYLAASSKYKKYSGLFTGICTLLGGMLFIMLI